MPAGSLGYAFQGKTVSEFSEAAATVLRDVKQGKLRFTPATKTEQSYISIRDLAESMHGEGIHALLGSKGKAKAKELHATFTASEATEGIVSTNFQDITQALIFQATLEQYQAPAFIRDQLFTFEQTDAENMREIGLADLDAKALIVPEGTEYPEVKYGEDYIDYTKPKKRGLKIGVTREMIFRDRTGDVVKKAQQVGKILGEDIEDRCLNVVLGVVNTFNRKGVARNTYLDLAAAPTDPRVNKILGNKLVDWTSLDAVEQLFIAMRDDRTPGQPISVDFNQLLVSASKRWNVNRILTATGIITNGTNSGSQPMATTQVLSQNPVAGRFSVISSPRLEYLLVQAGQTLANAIEFWWAGNFKKAFVYRVFFPFAVEAAAPNDIDEFDRDIVLKFRASEMGEPGVRAPWNVVENTPS